MSRRGEMVYTIDSKSIGGDSVRVQVPSPVFLKRSLVYKERFILSRTNEYRLKTLQIYLSYVPIQHG